MDLVVDSVTRTVRRAGQTMDALGQEIPFRMLEALLQARGGFVTRERLFQAAWGIGFRPGLRNRLNYNVWRARRLLGEPALLERARGAYRLHAERVRWVPPESGHEPLLDWIALRGRVTNRDLARRLGVSRTTALRQLDGLVRSGVLRRIGRGRASRYAPVHTIKACAAHVL